nr:integrase, catalytic region, zinc finger, CCHC-type, peptidase aspartic, catalytic [Tanacetum cinerariifolium]
MYEEYFNAGNQSVSKSSTLYKNLHQHDTQPTFNVQPTLESTIPPTDVNAKENNNDQAEATQFEAYEFINPFALPRTEALKQVCGNPSKPIQTRRQLATNPEMCMFALTVSVAEPKKIKEAMTGHAWIEAMQEELHQFDRLNVWESVDKPFGKNDCTAMSTAEAEYMALSANCAQVLWMRIQLKDYVFDYNKILMYYDS